MSEQKHTPGPWYSADDDHCHIRRDSDDAVIAEVFEDDGHCDPVHCRPLPSRANARLIAAAPDLLEALQYLCEVSHTDPRGFDAARAAIAKATGGAS